VSLRQQSRTCKVQCAEEHFCGKKIAVQPYDFAILATYVEVTFAGAGNTITVGNESCPSNEHNAVVSSMNCAFSNGFAVKLGIVDQEGGQFYKFFDNLVKCVKNEGDNGTIALDFGWIAVNCDGSRQKITVNSRSGHKVNLFITQMKIDRAAGAFHYTITCRDIGTLSIAAKALEDFGSDKTNRELDLKEAIKKLCTTVPPYWDVEFCRKIEGSDECKDFDFKAIEEKPKGNWKCSNKNKIDIIYDWVRNYKTDNGKGVLITYDDTAEKPKIIVWEAMQPECDEVKSCLGNNLGNFIVNGGNCSPVIDFNPSIDWIISWKNKPVGGHGPSQVDSKSKTDKGDTPKGKNPCLQDFEHQGTSSTTPVKNTDSKNYGKKTVPKVQEAENANALANSVFDVAQAITADLKIIGTVDKGFGHIIESVGSVISIAVINPFYLSKGGSKECPEWLSKPRCHQVLSNKNWQVLDVTHEIKGGKFTTTIKVTMGTPGGNMKIGGKLGGAEGITINCGSSGGK
jgi:hypothetical protein